MLTQSPDKHWGRRHCLGRLARSLAAVTGATTLLGCQSLAEPNKRYQPLLLTVRPPAPLPGQAWLFGSVHALAADFYPLPAAVISRWRRADRLAVELDVPARWSELKSGFSNVSLLPGNERIEHYLDPSSIRIIHDRFAIKPAQWRRLARLQPWALSLVLQQTHANRQGSSLALGIDRHFLNLARQSNRPISELETAAEQIGAFSNSPIDEQLALLKRRLADPGWWDSKLNELMAHWRTGNTAALTELKIRAYGAGANLAPLRQRLFDDRDQRMAQRLLQLMQSPEKVFTVIGAFHLIGKTALPYHLRKLGATVTPVQYAHTARITRLSSPAT